MNVYSDFLGIDLSKNYFDVAIILNSDQSIIVDKQFTNNNIELLAINNNRSATNKGVLKL